MQEEAGKIAVANALPAPNNRMPLARILARQGSLLTDFVCCLACFIFVTYVISLAALLNCKLTNVVVCPVCSVLPSILTASAMLFRQAAF